MNSRLTGLVALAAGVLVIWTGGQPGTARGDSAGDLAAGRAALGAGDVEKALPLLVAAAQGLPASVEAQLELAHGYLSAGQLDKALAQYRAVLKLSPDHAEAKRMADALSGQAKTADQRLALASVMMDVMAYQQATGVLVEAMTNLPCTDGQKLAGRQMIVESILWQQFTAAAVTEATKAINEAKALGAAAAKSPFEAQDRILAAMALVTVTTPENLAAVRELLKSADALPGGLAGLPPVWKQRAELVDFLIKLDTKMSPEGYAAIATLLPAVPPGGYRDELILRVAVFLSTVAKTRAEQGDWQTALKVVWPMISSQPMPAKLTPDAAMNLTGGWVPLKAHQPAANREQIVEALQAIGRSEFAADGSDAQLVGLWVASEYLRQEPADWNVAAYTTDKRLQLLDNLASMSRPAATRKKGDAGGLSVADTMQEKIIKSLASELVSEEQRQRLVGAIIGQVNRYKAAGDLEAGMKPFVGVLLVAGLPPRGAGDDATAAPSVALPPGAADRQLTEFLAGQLAALGQEAFAKVAAGGTADANVQLNRQDLSAIQLYARVLALYPGAGNTVLPSADAIINRYIAAEKWGAAGDATVALFKPIKGDMGKWALARLKARQVVHDEDQQLAAQHKLPDKLSAAVGDVLAAAVEIVKTDSSDANRDAAIALATGFVGRYAQLDRPDLAEAVIATMAAPPAGVVALADWAVVARANLLDAQAAAPLALAAQQFDGGATIKKLKLVDQHAAEVKLLGELIDKFPASRFLPGAIERVARIARTYQDYKSFDVSAQILADFVKAHPKLEAAQRLEFVRVQVLLSKAFAAFSDRSALAALPPGEKEKPPAKLSDEYAAAIDELAAFLKAHPAGPQSPLAETELVNVARTYGQAGAWPVSREVLKRFAAAVPDFRSPGQLRLMEAATYLGELDSAYGLSLLTAPAPPASGLMSDFDKYSRGVDGREWGGLAEHRRDEAGKELGPWRDHLDEEMKISGDKLLELSDATKSLTKSGSGTLTLNGGVLQRAAEAPPPRGPAGATGPVGEESELGAAEYKGDRRKDDLHDVPGETVAAIHQAQQAQAARIARMGGPGNQPGEPAQSFEGNVRGGQGGGGAGGGTIVLPSGPVLSEAEMKRQDAAADAAYAILIALVKDRVAGAAAAADRAAAPLSPALAPGGGSNAIGSLAAAIGGQARGEIMWLIGFFEGQLRANRAVAIIDQFLKDQPADQARVALAYQAVSDRVTWAGQRQRADKVDQAWVDARHDLFEQARRAIEAFVKEYSAPTEKSWVDRGRLLAVSSYRQEADLVAVVSTARAGGLLARSADELVALVDSHPDHPESANFPSQLWAIGEQLTNLGQRGQAIQVFSLLPVRFPTDPLASQAVQRIAGLYSSDLQAPLQAVETYQEYLSLVGDNETIRAQIFSVAQQLASKQRYLEAMHVYAIFVDSFPSDGRASQALQAIGQIHQSNEAWGDAIAAYQRVLDEYASNPVVPQVKLSIAECDIHLSQWKAARKIYEDYLQQYSGGGNYNNAPNGPGQPGPQSPQGVNPTSLAQSRIEILKSLDRYQTLLGDKEVTRNKDDAQFQIGRICLERLDNKVKAIEEFAKVVKNFPKSDQAAAAQFEIGKTLLALGRLDEARAALLKVPADYPTSPLAGEALYRVGQSYEQQAQKLGAVTLESARQVAFEKGQKGAYQQFAEQQTRANASYNIKREGMKYAATTQPAFNEKLERYEAANATFSGSNTFTGGQLLARNAEVLAETESALEVANRQDRINEAYREAVAAYAHEAKDYPLSTATGDALMRMAVIYETQLKDRPAAMATYTQILKFFPGTPVAEDAAWKLVKFYEQEQKFDQAVTAYRDFIRTYPASGRVADAQYAMAEALEQLGRWVEAMDAYQTFREKFPSSPKAPTADQQIQWIKAYRK